MANRLTTKTVALPLRERGGERAGDDRQIMERMRQRAVQCLDDEVRSNLKAML
jgi:hypothetical protein